LDEGQFRGNSYEHPHAPCVAISCDYYYSFYSNINSCPLLSRLQRLTLLTPSKRVCYLIDILKTNLNLGSPTPNTTKRDLLQQKPSNK